MVFMCVFVCVHEPVCGTYIRHMRCGNRNGCGDHNFDPQFENLELKEL